MEDLKQFYTRLLRIERPWSVASAGSVGIAVGACWAAPWTGASAARCGRCRSISASTRRPSPSATRT